MYALYDHGGTHGGNVWSYDWACLGVKADDTDAVGLMALAWRVASVGVHHGGRSRGTHHDLSSGDESPAGDVNGYFDNVQVWVDGEPYMGS